MARSVDTNGLGHPQLFRLLGIPVRIDASWFIILALLTLSLTHEFPRWLKDYYPEATLPPSWASWLIALSSALAFFVCILLHELGHAVVARSQQLPVRGITLFMFGGVADIGEEPRSPRSEFLMAIAGPFVSVVLAVLLSLLAWLGYTQEWAPFLVIAIGYLAGINVLVLAFNMIPAFPLDGGRVLRSILWSISGNLRRATYRAAHVGRFFAWMLIAWGVLNFFTGNWLGGIWFILLGLFLSSAAQSGYHQVLVRQALEGEPVRRFMNPDPITIPPNLDLRQWVEDYVYRFHRKMFPVVQNGELQGYIETRMLAGIPRSDWELNKVSDVMRCDLDIITIGPDDDALEALRRMQQKNLSRLLVVEGNRLIGIISLKDLLQFFNLKLELEGEEDNSFIIQGPTSDSRAIFPQ